MDSSVSSCVDFVGVVNWCCSMVGSGEAQNISSALRGELGRSSGNNALKPHEREAAARVALNVMEDSFVVLTFD
jgi:hypothetical protein